jgi:HEAT repeat protein
MTRLGTTVASVVLVWLGGCATTPPQEVSINQRQLKRQALECLKGAVSYPHNPAVRLEAVEALESSGCEEGKPWIRLALLDEHPGVRFAACVAAGRLSDRLAQQTLGERAGDQDPSVRVGALFALHRLGDTSRTGWMPGYLLDHDDPTVRRNAALVLGLLEEPGAIKVLARAMKDGDAGVRHHALEAMARLGNPEARQELSFMTSAGVGSEEVFAINALAGTSDPIYQDAFLYKLETATHLETKLAAARGLGLLGCDDGFRVALSALRADRPRFNDPKDPPEVQVLRARQLAAAALGAIGRVDALPALKDLLEGESDPRIEVSAARAILEIIKANTTGALPFASSQVRRRR